MKESYHVVDKKDRQKIEEYGKGKVHGIPLEYIWILGRDGDKELEGWLLGWLSIGQVKWGSSNRITGGGACPKDSWKLKKGWRFLTRLDRIGLVKNPIKRRNRHERILSRC